LLKGPLRWLCCTCRMAEQGGLEVGVENLQHLISNMDAVFRDVRDCINRWCGEEVSARRSVLVQVFGAACSCLPWLVDLLPSP
jgi:hypothetical protein